MSSISSVTAPTADRAQAGQVDNRPRFAIGHLFLGADEVETVADFYVSIGMRSVARMPRMAIVELRGGTHIVIGAGPVGEGSLDLIVDDLDETRSVIDAAGGQPSRITRGGVHDQFIATDPEGNRLVVNSTHAMGPV
ncbi:MAG: VOC family protein [Actinomycetota bacterium]